MNSRNAVKLACETGEILFTSRCIPQLLEKLENWLDRLNTPLVFCLYNELLFSKEIGIWRVHEHCLLQLQLLLISFRYCEQ